MVFTRQKSRAGASSESPARSHPGKNIREVPTPIRTVFTKEKNELFIHQVLQYSQEEKVGEFHYRVPSLKESSTEVDMKKPTVIQIVNFTLTKISIHKLLK